MRKNLVLTLAILFLIPATCHAQARGALTNVWASWASVTAATTTFSPPSNSRDLWIHNGSAVDVCVSLRGGTIQNNCYERVPAGEHHTMQLDGASDFYGTDFVTNSITVRSATGATASPVSVVVTY